MALTDKLTAIADAIRSKSGKTATMTLDEMPGEIASLSGSEILINHSDIPDYVKEETLRVANLVQSVRQNDSIVFLAMSDNHYYGAQEDSDQYPDSDGIQTNESNLHAAMAAKALAYGLKFDFMVQLGDMVWGNQKTTSALLHEQMGELGSFLRESHKDIPFFHAIGNHDTGIYYHNQMINDGNSGVYTESGQWLYNNFTALSASENTVFGSAAYGGYCYRDFPGKKLRVFLLNTSEALVKEQKDSATLGSQRKWFADALNNLNSKTDAANWSFLVLSHYPADYGGTMPLSEVLKSYVEGGSVTISIEDGTSATVSFAGKNYARFIAQFHGHVHNFLSDKLSVYKNGAKVQYDAWRICIPNAQYNRENYYTTVGSYTDISFKEETTYTKIPDTAQDTSFVVNVINPGEETIYSFCYGAGRDRTIGYSGTVYHSVQQVLTNVTISDAPVSVESGKPFSAEITAKENYEIISVTVTMGGADITSSAYANGKINISSVTGDVVITAAARIVTSVINQIPISTDMDGSVYNGTGYAEGYYLSSGNLAAASGSYVSGFIPCKTLDTIYFDGCHITTNTDRHRFCFYDSNKNHLNTIKTTSTASLNQVYGNDGYLDSIKLIVNTGGSTANDSKIAYMRFCCSHIGLDSVCAVNEQIT